MVFEKIVRLEAKMADEDSNHENGLLPGNRFNVY